MTQILSFSSLAQRAHPFKYLGAIRYLKVFESLLEGYRQGVFGLRYSSLDENVGRTVGRYSSLFTLPSHTATVILLGVLCLLSGVLTILPFHFSFGGLISSLTFGGTFLFFTLLSDFTVSRSSMKRDPIFNLRRCSVLSLFSCLIWFGCIFLGSLTFAFLRKPNLWVRFFFLGFSGALMLRLLVFSTTSFADVGKRTFSSLLQPALCTSSIFFAGSMTGDGLGALSIIVLGSVSIVTFTVFLFIRLLDSVGKKTVGISSFSLFKAFLANWTEGLNAPLESFFEKLGSEQNVRVFTLTFTTGKGIKAMIVVPALHPGPFRNLGSSSLPSLIQNTLENKLQCVVSVPHGLVGHELDTSSQLQNQRVVEGILGFIDSLPKYSKATPFVRIKKKGGTSTCQIFGDCALLTLTMAPKTMEDLPQELDSYILSEAKKLGLSALVINAHNSIKGPFDINEALAIFREASVSGLKKTLNYEQSVFEIGAANVFPEEFTTKEGMGPGGISVILTRVRDQKAAYVTIDGNNMISGLREKILSELAEIGIVDGEVLTTDTHTVCGVVLTPRGYHPIGEVVDQSKLIGYVRQAAVNALGNLEPAGVSLRTATISKINVIGEKQIEKLCLVADKTAKRAKRLAFSLFPPTVFLLILLSVFL